ncbi:hypothetical protein BKA67DRAFT_42495 [Truncatella angustata]|uniref:HMG box domain-containing protein n=1 Tax=Truncatella angustata TaxID=152316 RepID=A0A9P9A3H5_9PEZI|nr:uncharacterized protein BKA67DRAFT_42495 [Truncatella angustata]KAH6660168.1 hypothetical protein BKA67DRAFT_42495 [Truncatella angustata]KAH8201035.1 hypothetical protein TruAng_004808 [Truncatella angustata]
MLSSIGRAAVRRLTSKPVPTSFVLSRTVAEQNSLASLASSFAKSCALRTFATTSAGTQTEQPVGVGRGRPKKTATTTPATTSTKASPKPKAKAAKPKKKKKVVAKKPTKPKSAGRPKKPLTQEQKDQLKLKEYKQKALFQEEPRKGLPTQPWNLFLAEQLSGQKYDGAQDVKSRFTEVVAKFKALSSSELEQLRTTSEENKLKNAATYKAWVESIPLARIVEANNARTRLKSKFNYPKHNKMLIKDDRIVKRLLSSFTYFTKARWASGEFSGKVSSSVAKDLGAEWRSLSEAEKQPYIELARADANRYHREMEAANLQHHQN